MVFLAIHSDPKADEMKKAVAELEMPWPVALDTEKKVMKAFQCDSYPDYCLIDRKGVLRFVDVSNAEVPKAVELLINEKP